jgi:hypothetical protein
MKMCDGGEPIRGGARQSFEQRRRRAAVVRTEEAAGKRSARFDEDQRRIGDRKRGKIKKRGGGPEE